MDRSLAVVVLAAGAGSRMKSAVPKVLHRLAGRSMLAHVLAGAGALKPARIVGVVGSGRDDVAAAFAPHAVAVQDRPLGTAHALRAALPALDGFAGDVLVVYGDTPLVEPATLARLLRARRAKPRRGAAAAVGVLGFRAKDPSPYGRFVLDGAGALVRIVETRDATPAERRIDLCNAGVMAIDGAALPDLLARVRDDNSRREFYLTSLVEIAAARGLRCVFAEGEEAEFLGVNSRAELAAAEAALQGKLRARAMAGGATLADPATVWLSWDTRLGRDVEIGPNCVFGPGVSVEDGVRILGFCHIEGARIRAGARIGPFARVRPSSDVGQGAHVGNFVELKNAAVGAGAKANHLAYVGDAEIGAGANVGAGTVFVNYDGFGKHRTRVGRDAFVGSNSSLVAPLAIGDRAYVTAGSVVVEDAPADALVFGRARQATKPGRAPELRERNRARAEAAKAAPAPAKGRGGARPKGKA